MSHKTNELYAWGMGDNYVLGTREDDNEFKPKLVNPKHFLENRVKQIGTGVQHLVFLTTASKEEDSCIPDFDKASLLLQFDPPVEEPAKESENGVTKEPAEESKGEAAQTS